MFYLKTPRKNLTWSYLLQQIKPQMLLSLMTGQVCMLMLSTPQYPPRYEYHFLTLMYCPDSSSNCQPCKQSVYGGVRGRVAASSYFHRCKINYGEQLHYSDQNPLFPWILAITRFSIFTALPGRVGLWAGLQNRIDKHREHFHHWFMGLITACILQNIN